MCFLKCFQNRAPGDYLYLLWGPIKVKYDCAFISWIAIKKYLFYIFFHGVSGMGSSLSIERTSQQMSTCLIKGLICMALQLLLHTVYKVLW